eukprot:CAMPEP_0182424736 /NCGR_PEP_ID=MMETSP1167-20130531/10990_1 /TAXON_ID=2988 /ORGANISM="Mallomonas Sp, Strain CCMP3275" /LENGTH=226 /DNA_ID=CAMNT_0024604767 /DNA_START=444 /DNA_END=1124 /DNA_ORIENTATION=+
MNVTSSYNSNFRENREEQIQIKHEHENTSTPGRYEWERTSKGTARKLMQKFGYSADVDDDRIIPVKVQPAGKFPGLGYDEKNPKTSSGQSFKVTATTTTPPPEYLSAEEVSTLMAAYQKNLSDNPIRSKYRCPHCRDEFFKNWTGCKAHLLLMGHYHPNQAERVMGLCVNSGGGSAPPVAAPVYSGSGYGSASGSGRYGPPSNYGGSGKYAPTPSNYDSGKYGPAS